MLSPPIFSSYLFYFYFLQQLANHSFVSWDLKLVVSLKKPTQNDTEGRKMHSDISLLISLLILFPFRYGSQLWSIAFLWGRLLTNVFHRRGKKKKKDSHSRECFQWTAGTVFMKLVKARQGKKKKSRTISPPYLPLPSSHPPKNKTKKKIKKKKEGERKRRTECIW